MRLEYSINKKTYDSIAEKYADNAFSKQWMKGYVEDFATGLTEGSKVLDLGCGPGNDAKTLIDLGMEVTGIDFSEEMIKQARIRVPEGIFIQTNLVEMELTPHFYDALWSVGTLHFISKEDLVEVMNRSFQSLKSGAIGFISLQSGEGEGLKTESQIGTGEEVTKFWSYWNRADLELMLKKVGFQIAKITETDSMRKEDLPPNQEERWLNVWLRKV